MSPVQGDAFPRLGATNPGVVAVAAAGAGHHRAFCWLIGCRHFSPSEGQEAARRITTEPPLLRAAGASLALQRCWDWHGGEALPD